MTAMASSVVTLKHSGNQFLTGTQVEAGRCLGPQNMFLVPASPCYLKSVKSKRSLTVQASGDGGRSSVFVGGFVLGGIIVGALGCFYAPQISKAIAGTDRKELMRKLPKFIYDEEKALERTRKILTEKIAQLNSAIDDVSAQLRADDAPNGAAVAPDELEASV